MAEEQPPQPESGATPAGDAEAPRPAAHRGPPIEVAEEVLNAKGEATAKTLAAVVGNRALEAGGRDDIPWVRVAPTALPAVAQHCRDDATLAMDMLHCLLAVDYIERIELNYVLFSIAGDRKAIIKVDLPADDAAVATITPLWEAAAWYEREAHDLFGVRFNGNDDLAPLLLYEGFEGHPGLKSFPMHDYDEY